MVDLLWRSGRIKEAVSFVEFMAMEPSASVLGALLSSCFNHGWVEVGEAAGKKLIETVPEHDGRNVGLSNVHATGRRWDKQGARGTMEMKGIKEAPGFSSVEVDGFVHGFTAHDRSQDISFEICNPLRILVKQMKAELELPISVDQNIEHW